MNANAISAFEYVSILVSLILGLGITHILSSLAEAFHHYQKVKFYWPHTVWVAIVLFLHIQEWFIFYELKNLPVWKLPTFLFIILYPVALYTVARIIFPLSLSEEAVDLKAYYYTAFPRLFYLFAFCILLSVLFNLLLLHANAAGQIALLLPAAIFILMAVRKPQSERMHKGIVLAVLFAILTVTLAELNAWYSQ